MVQVFTSLDQSLVLNTFTAGTEKENNRPTAEDMQVRQQATGLSQPVSQSVGEGGRETVLREAAVCLPPADDGCACLLAACR